MWLYIPKEGTHECKQVVASLDHIANIVGQKGEKLAALSLDDLELDIQGKDSGNVRCQQHDNFKENS